MSPDGSSLLCPDEQLVRCDQPDVVAPVVAAVLHDWSEVARVVHPRQDGDSVLRVQSGAARDLDVAVSVAVELVSSIWLVFRAACHRDPETATGRIFARDVGESTFSVKREDARCIRKV